jgi:hypothetical protein
MVPSEKVSFRSWRADQVIRETSQLAGIYLVATPWQGGRFHPGPAGDMETGGGL